LSPDSIAIVQSALAFNPNASAFSRNTIAPTFDANVSASGAMALTPEALAVRSDAIVSTFGAFV